MNQVKAYKILEDSGFSRENAEGLVEAFNENENLATKGDLNDLKSELKGDLKDLEIRMLGEFNKVKDAINSQTKWFLTGIGLIAVIFKLADLFIHIPSK